MVDTNFCKRSVVANFKKISQNSIILLEFHNVTYYLTFFGYLLEVIKHRAGPGLGRAERQKSVH